MAFADFDGTVDGSFHVETQSWGYRLFANLDAATPVALASWVQKFMGGAAVVAALALWVVPGSQFDLDVLAFKAAISLGLLGLGYVWMRQPVEDDPHEVHVDLVRQEVRLVATRGRDTELRRLYRFSELGGMDVRNGALLLRDQTGAQLAEVALDGRRHGRSVA